MSEKQVFSSEETWPSSWAPFPPTFNVGSGSRASWNLKHGSGFRFQVLFWSRRETPAKQFAPVLFYFLSLYSSHQLKALPLIWGPKLYVSRDSVCHWSISELLFLFKNAFWWSGGKAWVFLEARTVLPSIFHIMTQVLYKMILEGHSGKDGWIVYGRSTGRAFQPLQSSSVLTIDPQDVPVCLPARCSGLERAKSHHPQLWTHRFIIEG